MNIKKILSFVILPIVTSNNNIYSNSVDIGEFSIYGDQFNNGEIVAYTKPLEENSGNIKVHKVLGDPNSELVTISTNNGSFSLIDNKDLQEPGYNCGIVKYDNIYYLAFYAELYYEELYSWLLVDNNNYCNFFGTTQIF